jgi:hypothetical protein
VILLSVPYRWYAPAHCFCSDSGANCCSRRCMLEQPRAPWFARPFVNNPERYIRHLWNKVPLPGVGHWTEQDATSEVNRLMLVSGHVDRPAGIAFADFFLLIY